jgi:hypothetical protein
MLGNLSKIGAVAAIIMIPTALSAQMGGAVNPGVHVGGRVNAGATVRGAVERGILARIWGLGGRRVRKFTVLVSIVRPPQSRADDGADCHGQSSLLVGHRSGAKGRWIEAHQASALGSFVDRRYSGCTVDSCRNVFPVGQPTMKRR